MKSFKTSLGETVKGVRLNDALYQVAQDWREIAHAIKSENLYASHVSEEIKADQLAKSLAQADRIENGEESGFWIWQRVNQKLTGQCVALLPK